MDNSVLRGFCKKCEQVIEYSIKEKNAIVDTDIADPEREWCLLKLHEPVWFLSAIQITIIGRSKVYGDWIVKNNDFRKPINHYETLAEYVDEFPFLVAEILKENKDKQEVKK